MSGWSERDADSSDEAESERFKLLPRSTALRFLFTGAVRLTKSCGMVSLVSVFWKFIRRFARPSGPSPAESKRG